MSKFFCRKDCCRKYYAEIVKIPVEKILSKLLLFNLLSRVKDIVRPFFSSLHELQDDWYGYWLVGVNRPFMAHYYHTI